MGTQTVAGNTVTGNTKDAEIMTVAVGQQLSEFARVAREMSRPVEVELTLEAVMHCARQVFACDAAGILLFKGRQITTAAATEPAVARADDLQTGFREGPCVAPITRHEDFVSEDLGTDPRWPSWGPRAAELGWRSILSIGLAKDDDRPFAALNLYSRQRAFFDVGDFSLGGVFGAHAAIALVTARERESLQQAMNARHLVGQAQGILMERYQIDAEQAFTVLRRYSSHLNRKLRQVAADIVAQRQLPAVSEKSAHGD